MEKKKKKNWRDVGTKDILLICRFLLCTHAPEIIVQPVLRQKAPYHSQA